jgi:hypothetical protein
VYQKFIYNDDGFLKESPENEPKGCWTWSFLLPVGMFILLLILSALLSGCRTAKPATVVVVRDSIRTEVHTETVYVHDTIPVQLPKDSVGIATPDTTSRIETSVAISEASIRDGLLWHSIWNKPTIEVPVEHKETVRDSIVYREKEVPVPYPVEVKVEKELNWWQQLRLWLGTAALILILAAVCYGIFRLYMKLKPGI